MQSHSHPIVDADTQARREAFYNRIAPHSLAPLWEVLRGLVPPEPRPVATAHLWRWEVVRNFVMEAGQLLTAEEAERRVLVLENPAYRGQSRATSTLYAGVQLVLPGEVAPAHRHTQSALRFVLESKGGYTAVSGEKTIMRPGDFVTTPAWSFHDHGNDSDGPILWMDVLDVPIVAFFEGGFSQHYNDSRQTIVRPEGDALARYGSGLLPLKTESPHGLSSPVFNYPYERTREALMCIAKAGNPDPHWAYTLRYANPLDGGWALPTISSWMTHLPAGVSTAPVRSTDGLIFAVAEGSGSVRVGDQKLTFGPRDIFVAPNWTWRSFHASEHSFLFFCSDRVVQEKLGLWRDERAPAGAD
jgi:gentisate 1,2-dioxygenase